MTGGVLEVMRQSPLHLRCFAGLNAVGAGHLAREAADMNGVYQETQCHTLSIQLNYTREHNVARSSFIASQENTMSHALHSHIFTTKTCTKKEAF